MSDVYDLEDIEVMEISIVDSPANQYASVVLAKSSGYTADVKPENEGETHRGDVPVAGEDTTRKMADLEAQVADLTKRLEAAETARAALVKSAIDAGLTVEGDRIVKRAEPEYVEIDGEKVEKALVPAPILRAIEKQAAQLAEMKKAAEEAALAKRGAEELPNLAGTPLAKGRLLALVSEDAELLKALKAADAAMAKNAQEIGHSSHEDMTSPGYKLDKMARERAAATGVTFEVAYAEITKSGEGAALLAAQRNQAN
jgi:hypothetical protein